MSIEFSVGCPEDLFNAQIAAAVRDALEIRYSVTLPRDSGRLYNSEQLTYEGLPELQQLAVDSIGVDCAAHLCAMRFFHGAYLPAFIEPAPVRLPGIPGEFMCASLPRLIMELDALASAEDLPWADGEIDEYLRQDTYPDEHGSGVETYCYLLAAARVADSRRLPVWALS
jgi:hypothetical protein